MTLGHTKGIDILAFNPSTAAQYQVEVKTNLKSRPRDSQSRLFGRVVNEWQMDVKNETCESANLFYCFVHINPSRTEPIEYEWRFFIVPGDVVAKYVRDEHHAWLSETPLHQTSNRRQFRIGAPSDDNRPTLLAPLASDYEDNWDFLRID